MKFKQVMLFIAVSIAIFMFCIEYTGIVIVMPVMAKSLHLGAGAVQWCVLGYLLSFASLIIIAGSLGDRYGHQKILTVGLVLFAIGSLLGGVSVSAMLMIVSRFVQGIGAALMWPNATAIAFNAVSKEKKSFAIGIVTSVVGFGMAAGPLLAGVLTALWSWRLFFWINVPFAIIAILITKYTVILTELKKRDALSYVSLLALVVAIFSIMMAITILENNAHELVLVVILVAVGIGSALYFLRLERKHAIIGIDLLGNIHFMVGCIIRALTNAGFYVFMFIISFYLHGKYAYTPVEIGVLFLPMTLMIGFFSPLAGKLSDRYGNILSVSIGLMLFSFAYILFSLVFKYQINSYVLLCGLFLLPGLAYGFSSPGLLTLTMKYVPEHLTGVASGVFYMASVLGSSVGVASATIILRLNDENILRAIQPILMLCLSVSVLGLVLLYVSKKATK